MENLIDKGSSARPAGLLAWQYAAYLDNHHDHTNLALHAATVPLFMLGNVALLAAPFVNLWLLPAGALASFFAIALQGRGHAREAQAPAPFRGPADVFARILAEQWITFPRFVWSGGFARALRGGS